MQNKKKQIKILKIIRVLRKETKNLTPPMVPVIIQKYGKNPFIILISCLLSLRTRDSVTLPVSLKLFEIAKTPEQFLKIPLYKLENYIKSVNYYKTKAKLIHEISRELIVKFDSNVPKNEKDLLSLKGVGQKTANLVLANAFDVPALYVDTHVHRLSNELKVVHTKTADQTQIELKKIIPKKYWKEWSNLLVVYGQNNRFIKPIIEKIK